MKPDTIRRTTTAELVVWDEHWPECADTLRVSLIDVAGVNAVAVDPISGILTVTFRPSVLPLKELVALVRDEGFSVAVDAICST